MNDGLGTITPCYTVTFNRRSKHSAKRLWAAITEPDQVSKWMDGAAARIDLRPGGEYNVDFGLDGVIIRVEPERLLSYAWGWSVVEWKIEDDDQGSLYTFVQNGLADRGEDEEGLPAGWHAFFDQLDEHLDGGYASEEARKQRWFDLKPGYRELLDAALPR